TMSAPSSFKMTASTAEASRTNLLTVFAFCFHVAFAQELVHDALASTPIGRECGLYFTNDLCVRNDVKSAVPQFDGNRIARMQSEFLASLGRNGNTPALAKL